jgi:hypothetical protein
MRPAGAALLYTVSDGAQLRGLPLEYEQQQPTVLRTIVNYGVDDD